MMFLFFSRLFAATYYISNSGNDSNNGLSQVYPFESIAKLNSIMQDLLPGDIILFERDGVYSGQINIKASGITNKPLIFGAYGTGRNPVISGSIQVSNWKPYKGNIYSSYVKSKVKDIFVNGERMILARYPNSGYLRINKPFPNPKNGFTDEVLNQKKGYWDSCNVRIRTENWAYENAIVKNFSKGSITFVKPNLYSSKKGWGYYLDNKLDQLDMAGEWYYDKYETDKENVYLFAPDSKNPNSLFVQASVIECGFFSALDLKNVIIQDLEFQNQIKAGIYLSNKCSNVKIENCTFSGQGQFGITIPISSENIEIINCRFYNIIDKAIYILNTTRSILTNNILLNIGMVPGYCNLGDAFSMSGIIIFGNNVRITGNNINVVGHDGINCIGAKNFIEKNVIKNTLLLLNDGGAIKCFGKQSNNSSWNNNFIFNVIGNLESTDIKNNKLFSMGIYLDELSNNMTITNNTIVGSTFAGIGTNAGFNNFYRKNISYNNDIGAFFYQDKILCRNNNFSGNIIFNKNSDDIVILNQSFHQINVPGNFNENIYFNPSSYNVFRIIEDNIESDYNFDKWKDFVKSDENSEFIVNDEVINSKLFTNMTDDTLSIILKGNIRYKNSIRNTLNGSLILVPWSSSVLTADTPINKFPEINIAGSALKFEGNDNQDVSDPLWFNLIGNNLQNNVTVTAPGGFLISLKNDRDFSNNIILTPDSGKLDKIIFVLFVPNEDRRFYDFISIESPETSGKIKVSGKLN